MKIEEIINELDKYFIDKLFNLDYEFIKCTKYLAFVRIDNKYDLMLWISNGANNLKIYTYDDYIPIYQTGINPAEKRNALWDNLMKDVSNYRRNILIEDKRRELKELEAQL